jgi:hypothetical protein
MASVVCNPFENSADFRALSGLLQMRLAHPNDRPSGAAAGGRTTYSTNAHDERKRPVPKEAREGSGSARWSWNANQVIAICHQ